VRNRPASDDDIQTRGSVAFGLGREKKKKTYSATQDGKKEGLYDMRDVSWIVHI
jgi:hypothetical protein